jgi:DNA-binding Xre family transcriptional regulator
MVRDDALAKVETMRATTIVLIDHVSVLSPDEIKDRLARHVGEIDELRELIEDMAAERTYERVLLSGREMVPDAVAARLIEGQNPIRVWREHRGLSLRELAGQAAISPSLLSDIERGKSEGKPSVLGRLARALSVDIDDLLTLDEKSSATSRGP